MDMSFLSNIGSLIVPVTVCAMLAVVILAISYGFFRHSDDSVALVFHIVGYICAGIIIYLVGSYMFHRAAVLPENTAGNRSAIEQSYEEALMER